MIGGNIVITIGLGWIALPFALLAFWVAVVEFNIRRRERRERRRAALGVVGPEGRRRLP